MESKKNFLERIPSTARSLVQLGENKGPVRILRDSQSQSAQVLGFWDSDPPPPPFSELAPEEQEEVAAMKAVETRVNKIDKYLQCPLSC